MPEGSQLVEAFVLFFEELLRIAGPRISVSPRRSAKRIPGTRDSPKIPNPRELGFHRDGILADLTAGDLNPNFSMAAPHFSERIQNAFSGLGRRLVRRNKRARAADLEFCVLTEAGVLEAQALLLCRSIRKFAGAYSSAAIVAVSPRPDRRPGRASIEELERLHVEYLELDVQTPLPSFGPAFKIHAVAHIARRAGPPVLVQIDSDTLFLSEPDFSLEHVDVAARPVDVKGICTAGADDPLDEYWQSICRLCEIEYEQLPLVTTTVDGETVRASYNGGLVAVRRDSGILQRAEDFFLRLITYKVRPNTGSGVLRSGVETVTAENYGFWGVGQAALSLSIASMHGKVKILPATYNVPLHMFDLLDPAAGMPIHVHYHWLCSVDGCPVNPMLDGRMALSDDVLAWLKQLLPLNK